MPGAFPAAPPVLSGDLLTISRFLQSPAQVGRRLRDFTDLRFVADQILTGRYKSQGGAVMFEQSEPFLTDRAVESVGPGAEYPYANLPTGTAALAAVVKWGQAVFLSDEEILRNAYALDPAVKALQKVVNSIIKQVDGVALAAVASAVTQTQAAAAAWSSVATANPFLDVQLAKSTINGLNLGYRADTILMGDVKYAYFTANNIVTNQLRREDTTNPIYTGQIDKVAGLTIVVSPNLPTADVWVLDSTQLGGMADEQDSAPGYTVAEMAIQTQSKRIEKRDGWDIWGRRKTVPVVQEPGAAIRITGS
jgi:hypothetical protein